MLIADFLHCLRQLKVFFILILLGLTVLILLLLLVCCGLVADLPAEELVEVKVLQDLFSFGFTDALLVGLVLRVSSFLALGSFIEGLVVL
jgi:hypothetical protein